MVREVYSDRSRLLAQAQRFDSGSCASKKFLYFTESMTVTSVIFLNLFTQDKYIWGTIAARFVTLSIIGDSSVSSAS